MLTKKQLKAFKKTKRGYLFNFDAWGDPTWKVSHGFVWSYPEKDPKDEDKQRVRIFFKLLPFILPCGVCGLHFIDTVENELPLSDTVLESRKNLTTWLFTIHNKVNARLKHPLAKYEDVETYYLKDSSIEITPRPLNPFKIATIVLSIVLLILLIYSIVITIKVSNS